MATDRKEYARQYRMENRERIAVQLKEWCFRNSDRLKEARKKWYLENKEAVAYKVAKWKTENKDSYYESNKKWAENNPEKRRAHWKTEKAIKTGKILKPDACSKCGWIGVLHAHHPDYSEPLAVMWLCPSCHGKEHRL